MGIDNLSQNSKGTTIECALRDEQKQFTIDEIDETPSGGVQFVLTEDETGDPWTLTQHGPNTYNLETSVTQRIERLTGSDITIR